MAYYSTRHKKAVTVSNEYDKLDRSDFIKLLRYIQDDLKDEERMLEFSEKYNKPMASVIKYRMDDKIVLRDKLKRLSGISFNQIV